MYKYAYSFALLGLASSELLAIIKFRNERERIVPKAEARIGLLRNLITKAENGASGSEIRKELEDADKINSGANLTKTLEDMLKELEESDMKLIEAKKRKMQASEENTTEGTKGHLKDLQREQEAAKAKEKEATGSAQSSSVDSVEKKAADASQRKYL